ncbi:hypothetical protein WN48_05309 [Eufriesea mexicana]|uniref:Copia protein n=1 Tax=Eufriesea mexicana TaxID=516756 RepID=A0A310S436_9HYME|nr:hypothetical protein WN48_05309 [Eufriesea mexicana]
MRPSGLDKSKGNKTLFDSSQDSDVVERKDRSIIKMILILMINSDLLMYFWVEAVNTAVYIKDRTKSAVRQRSPYKVQHERKVNMWYMKKFGSIAYGLNKV